MVQNTKINLEYGCIAPYLCCTILLHNIIKYRKMETIGLKEEILKQIKGDGMLYGKVATVLGLKPSSLRKILAENDPKLTQASVLRILREHLGIVEDSELLEPFKEPAKITA